MDTALQDIVSTLGREEDLPTEVRAFIARVDAVLSARQAEADALRDALTSAQRAMADQAERIRALSQRASEVEAILYSLPDAYGRLSPDGVWVEMWRPKGRDFVRPVEEIVGRSIRDVLPEEAVASFQRAMAEARATGRTIVFDFSLFNGTERLSREARLSPFRDGQFVVALRSTTQEREVQARLLVADRMASLGTLAAGVGHEINNPLAAVLANLDWLQERLPEVLENAPPDALEAIREVVTESRQAADRVAVIARDLRSVSRGDDTRLVAVDLHGVIETALKLTMNELRHRARVVRAFERVPEVRGNEGRLVQVFVNLLINAAQAIQEGHVEGNEIRVTTTLDGPSWVEVTVHDTGHGIPQELLVRIFDPFFTTRGVGMGTGLGLSICHHIVTSMHGVLTVESEAGKGSTFRVRLPVWEGADVPPSVQ